MAEHSDTPQAAAPFWKKPAFWLVLAVLAAALVLYVYQQFAPAMPDTAPVTEGEKTEAAGYVYITAGQEGRWYALPVDEEAVLRLERGDMVNEIKLIPDGVYMHASTCDNQDCVMQGTITLENKDERILGNFIVCLPHQVAIELYSRDEVMASQAE